MIDKTVTQDGVKIVIKDKNETKAELQAGQEIYRLVCQGYRYPKVTTTKKNGITTITIETKTL